VRTPAPPAALGLRLEALAQRRADADESFFATEADRIARLCHAMAERFARGGRLIAVGGSPGARSDVRHVAVEFVHPVIVGKRALPAIGLAQPEAATAVRDLVVANDIVMAVGTDRADPEAGEGLQIGRDRGCLTIALRPAGADWDLAAPDDDPFVRQELAEATYHLLWELVHVFFEHRGLLEGRTSRAHHDSGASAFLYPFLAEQEHDVDAVVADVRDSVLMKAQEIARLRAQTLGDNRDALVAAAVTIRASTDAGGTLLAFGNGGSATDAMDAVADMRAAPQGWPSRRALDLSEDPAILTAIANDVGVEAIFARQVIAYGRQGDVALSFSTSGNSPNMIAALIEARRGGLQTIAMVGYGGGRVYDEGLADIVIITRSEHIPRIQEAQASAWHVIRELVEHAAP
jgi:D-sedoheptulose 7-phosphate isomerase